MYNSDVRKLYDLKDPAWRYDIMPEIMNGKNVSGRFFLALWITVGSGSAWYGRSAAFGQCGIRTTACALVSHQASLSNVLQILDFVDPDIKCPASPFAAQPAAHRLQLTIQRLFLSFLISQILDFVDPDIDARLEALEREEEAAAAAHAEVVSQSCVTKLAYNILCVWLGWLEREEEAAAAAHAEVVSGVTNCFLRSVAVVGSSRSGRRRPPPLRTPRW